MEGKSVRFAQLLTLHVNNVIQKNFINESLTPELMRSVHACIRKTIDEVFMQSSHKLSADARGWLSNQFFKAIQVNGDQRMGDLVVFNEYKLADLPYHDIELMRNLFNETALNAELEGEYRRRSQS